MFDNKKSLSEELVDYFKKNLRKGYTKESLRWALVNQGYSRREVEKALKQAEEDFAKQAPLLKTRPQIDYQRISPVEPVVEEKPSFWKRLFG